MRDYNERKQEIIKKIKNLISRYKNSNKVLAGFQEEMTNFLAQYEERLRKDMEDLPIWLLRNIALKEIDQNNEIIKFLEKTIEYLEESLEN